MKTQKNNVSRETSKNEILTELTKRINEDPKRKEQILRLQKIIKEQREKALHQ